MPNLDHFDRLILREMQRDCRQSSEQIADIVALSATAVQRRIKRLRETGVIHSEQAIIDGASLGFPLRVIVQVCLTHGGAESLANFKQRCLALAEIQQCYYVTGDYDFVLIITVHDMSHYERLTQNLFLDNPAIQKFQTLVVMDAVKMSLQIPID